MTTATPPAAAACRSDLPEIVAQLRDARLQWRTARGRSRCAGERELPSVKAIGQLVRDLTGALFPMRLGPDDLREEHEDAYVELTLARALTQLRRQICLALAYQARHTSGAAGMAAAAASHAADITDRFAAQLPALRRLLDTDVTAAYQGDPAAQSVDEVLLCYPGVTAMIHHRLAHTLYTLGVPLVARIIAEIAHSDTGIDIHPGARIGPSFFIDHGTGVVIGETAIIGARVRLYQHVTLGAKSFPASENGELKKGLPRHPVIEDDVVIYAGATILGRVTVGRGSTIGGNVWLTQSVPPNSVITQASNVQDCPERDAPVSNLHGLS